MSDNVDSYFEALGSIPLNPIGFVVYAVLFVLHVVTTRTRDGRYAAATSSSATRSRCR